MKKLTTGQKVAGITAIILGAFSLLAGGFWGGGFSLIFGGLFFLAIGIITFSPPHKSEIEKLNEDLDRINSNLSSLEKQIDDMLASAVTVPYAASFDCMDGHAFEYFCADILRKNGFFNVEVTKGSGDHGIDILAEKDGIKYAIQCKCYDKNIGNAAVQQAYTGKGFYNRDIAVVLTNRYFTPQAIEEANALGVKLWDRDKLNEIANNNI